MEGPARKIVVLGTGGTIAGTAPDAGDHVGYRAAQLGVAALVAAAAGGTSPPSWQLETEQVAQIDSADLTHAVWQLLVRRAAAHLARDDVGALVVTHGTDTLEETAYLLHRVLAPAKPLVLTAAMRPATALQADGPQNLNDALTVAAESGARGVLAVIGGHVFAGAELRKQHPYRLDAFGAGDAGALGAVEQGTLRRWREWPSGAPLGPQVVEREVRSWPRVEIVTSHAGSDGRIVDALLAQGVDGLVVAGVGNGHVHMALQAALARARARGVAVALTTRCTQGVVVGATDDAGALTPVQARVELLLRLLAAPPEPG